MVLANMWFQTLMRQFFFNLDKIVFNFIPIIYNFLIDLSRTSILSQADIVDMADRIYKLLAVFMVFKVTFSLIMYVVNPDDFSDKTKGISKLGANIIISLALLILTPYLFSYAYKLQNILLEDNAMATLILGNKSDDGENFFNTAGDTMAYMTLVPFFTPDSSISSGGTVDGIYECSKLTISSDGKEQFNPNCSGISNDDFTPNEADNETLYSLTKDNEKFSFQTLKNYVAGVNNKNLGLTFRQDLAVATYTADDEEVFIMDYKYLISTVVGVVTVLLLITFCMDVAIRSIKLAFLQLIAPIPIISYVDPKSGKDGLFKKWYTMCFQTFVSLFVRLLALYFAIYIISRIDNLTDIIDGSYKSGPILKIFVVIGALMFAKQLPNILKGLGIKLDGDGKFTLNPLKKFENEALGGKRITGAAGALTSGLADRTARIATAPGAKGKLKALAGTAPGLLGAASRGFRSNAGFKGGLDKQAQVNRRLREGRINGLSPMSSYLDYMGSIYGLDDATLEKEGTLIRKNEDSIRRAETELANKNRANSVWIENEKKLQTTRKNTKAKFDSAGRQGKRMLDAAADFTSKKGDFFTGAERDKKISELNKEILDAKNNYITRKTGVDAKGNKIDMDINEYYAREKRNINEENYKSNLNADDANVQYLTNHNGETLENGFMVGNTFFPAGTVIDGDVIAQAKDAQGRYIKEANKGVANKMYKFATTKYEDLSEEDKAIYDSNKNDFDSFRNIYDEFNQAVDETNSIVNAYNSEYGSNISGLNANVSEGDFYSMVKDVNGSVESGNSITEINKKLATSNSEIEERERLNDENRRNIKIDYVDERGNLVYTEDENGNRSRGVSLEDAKSRNKTRDENNKYRIRQHQQRRSLMQDMSKK